MRGKKKGFTLVELIVVIAIIAIIAAVAVPTTIRYVNEAKVTMAENEALNLMNTITSSLAVIATSHDGKLAKDVMLDILAEQMPTVQYVTQVLVAQNGNDEFKITIHAGEMASKESSFKYSVFKVYWGEETATSFSLIPDTASSGGWVLE